MEIINTGGGKMKNKVIGILKKNGFLIVLFICVCVVAVSTILISTRELVARDDTNKKAEDMALVNKEREESIEKEKETEIETETKKAEDELQVALEEDKEDEKKELEEDLDRVEEVVQLVEVGQEILEEEVVAVEVFKEGEIGFVDDHKKEEEKKTKTPIMPVEGEIIQEHTTDTLVYSETLEEWRAHLGMDIKSPQGTKVKAVLDGRVKKAYYDKLWGNIIILDHGNGLETKYANLKTLDMVKEGVEVRQGDYISLVGKSADIEMLMDDHLHFEVIKNGKVVDPRSITD